MADHIQADYDQLAKVQEMFVQLGIDVDQGIIPTINHQLESLLMGWLGQSADKFFGEMANEVMPAMGALVNAMDRGYEITSEVSKSFRTAEEEGRSRFRHTGP